jgi:hypothetical protein
MVWRVWAVIGVPFMPESKHDRNAATTIQLFAARFVHLWSGIEERVFE